MRLIILMVVAVCQVACSGLMPKREYVDNTFFATNPKLAVQISEDFEFDEKESSDAFDFFSSGGEAGTNVSKESFRFLDMRDQKAFTVHISKISRGYWRANLNDWVAYPLEKGTAKIYGRNYQFASFANQTEDGSCLMVRHMAAIAGPSNQTLIELYYIKEIGPRFGDCLQWRDIDRLSNEQKNFLSEFNDTFSEDIQLLDPSQVERGG